MRANIEFKATTRKKHKGERLYKSWNGFAKNCNGDVSQFELGKLAL